MAQRKPQNTFPLPLHLEGAQRIVTSNSLAVIGWSGSHREAPPQPLMLAQSLLEPRATTRILYACNLPAPQDSPRSAPLDLSGSLPGEIGRDCEAEFLAYSLPGGQAAIIDEAGQRIAIQFRWMCVTSHFSIGAVWRCFIREGSRMSSSFWRAIDHDYIFEAGGGPLLNPPDEVTLPEGSGRGEVKLFHPEGMLTSFPCQSCRVKVTRCSADGWMKRQLLNLTLRADDSVVALFSDGTQNWIATAAPAQQQPARAA